MSLCLSGLIQHRPSEKISECVEECAGEEHTERFPRSRGGSIKCTREGKRGVGGRVI